MATKIYDNDVSVVGKVSQSGTPSVGADLITKTHLDAQLANKQAVVAGLTDLIARWIAASTAGPASLDFAEDIDQGTNRIRVIGQGTLSGDFTVTIPGVSGTLYLTGGTDVDVTDGGTGRSTSTTAYGILAAGTTATGPHQTISPGTTGHFLRSAGASALAAMAAIAQSDVTNLVTDLGTKTDEAGGFIENASHIEYDVNIIAASGSTETLDVSLFNVHDITMDAGCTFTFSNPAPTTEASVFVLILRGAFTPVFPASVDWGDGVAPTYTTVSMYSFFTRDAGTTWLGTQLGKAFA